MTTLKQFEDNIIQRMSSLRKEIKKMEGRNTAFVTKRLSRLRQLKTVYQEIRHFKEKSKESSQDTLGESTSVRTSGDKPPLEVAVSKDIVDDITKPLLLTTTDKKTLGEIEDIFKEK